MPSRLPPFLLVLIAALIATGCYQDEAVYAPQGAQLLARVFLTDAPFPYDSVASVNIHIVRIEANAQRIRGHVQGRNDQQGWQRRLQWTRRHRQGREGRPLLHACSQPGSGHSKSRCV